LSSWALLTVALSINLYRLLLPRVWTVGALLLRCAKDFLFVKTDRELAPFFLSLSVHLPERCSSPRLDWALLLSPRRALLLDGLISSTALLSKVSSRVPILFIFCGAPCRRSRLLPTLVDVRCGSENVVLVLGKQTTACNVSLAGAPDCSRRSSTKE
jgi:hypothetical protein